MQATKGLYQQLSPFTPIVTASLRLAVASIVSPLLEPDRAVVEEHQVAGVQRTTLRDLAGGRESSLQSDHLLE